MRYKGKKGKLWELCKELVRIRDGNVCVICGRCGLVGSNWHTGHIIPASTCGAFLRFDLRNIHSSCYNCNINLGGNGALFYRQLEKKYGKRWCENLFKDKQKIVKADDLFYQQKIEQYKKMCSWDKDQLFDFTRTRPE